MYCSHCGEKASGKFCSACGTRLAKPEAQEPTWLTDEGWINEIEYHRLIRYTAVRDALTAAAGRVKKSITAEEILAVVDALAPTGISLEKLTGALLPIYDRMGIRTGTDAEMLLTVPAGRALLSVLCAMIARGMEPSEVEQSADGCRLVAAIASSVFTNRGEISVTVQRRDAEVHLQATIKIMGQWYDWGKSKKLLTELFAEVRSELSIYEQENPRRTDAA